MAMLEHLSVSSSANERIMLNVYRNTGNGTCDRFGCSSYPKGLLHGLRFAVNHHQISACRTLWNAAALFPVANRIDAEAEGDRELLLRHSQAVADGANVDLWRNMHPVLTFVSAAIDECQRLFKPRIILSPILLMMPTSGSLLDYHFCKRS